MLEEIENVRQVPGERNRRWFMDRDMDLILWHEEEDDKVLGFQISFDKRSVQRTLTWTRGADSHGSLTCNGPYSKKRIFRLLSQKGERIDKNILQWILLQLKV